LKSVLIIKI